MITAANPRPLRALTDGNFFDNADQIVVLVVETRRVVARPRTAGSSNIRSCHLDPAG
jgi:hypothetical protein